MILVKLFFKLVMPMLGKLTQLDRMLALLMALLVVVMALLVVVMALLVVVMALLVVVMAYSKFANLELVDAKS